MRRHPEPPLVLPSFAAAPPADGPVSSRRVTVAIPTYNRAEALVRCLTAVSESDISGLDLEALVIDDGSSDGTGEAFRHFAAGYSGPIRFRYQRQENQGPAGARNTALSLAEGEVLLFLDDDCAVGPEWARELALAFDDARIGGVGGRIVPGETRTLVARYYRFRGLLEYPRAGKAFSFPFAGNSAYRKQALDACGGFERLFPGAAGEDADLARRVRNQGYLLAYQAAAVVRDHPPETLRGLLRASRLRGGALVLSRALWNPKHLPTRLRLWAKAAQLPLHLFLLLYIPLRAAGFLAGGAAVDALPFAVLDWLQLTWRLYGKVAMMRNILSGRQTLARSSVAFPVGESAAAAVSRSSGRDGGDGSLVAGEVSQ